MRVNLRARSLAVASDESRSTSGSFRQTMWTKLTSPPHKQQQCFSPHQSDTVYLHMSFYLPDELAPRHARKLARHSEFILVFGLEPCDKRIPHERQ